MTSVSIREPLKIIWSILILYFLFARRFIILGMFYQRTEDEWPVPRSVKNRRSFLGFANYYRRFVSNFAQLARPLHALVGVCQGHDPKLFHNRWSQECQEVFESTNPVLAFADFSKLFILDVDASLSGLGTVLSQIQEGSEHVIVYASRSLRDGQKRWRSIVHRNWKY